MGQSNQRQTARWQRRARTAWSTLVIALMLGACAPPSPPIASLATPTVTAAPRHAPEISYGLLGQVTEANVWAMFGGPGYSYNNYAVRAHYWPRLYSLSVPAQEFSPLAAAGPPQSPHQEGVFFTATVPLRSDLHWSDGSIFSAEDVAFTVNTALDFELGFDWADFYPRGKLDHAEALAPDTVKFFFREPPGVGRWQYGALQGPVVQAHYWAPRVATAADSLPDAEQRGEIDSLKDRISTLQQTVDELYAATLVAQGEDARQLQADLRRQQGNLDEAINSLSDAQAALEGAFQDARQALFDADDAHEPLLGPWLPEEPTRFAAGGTTINVPVSGYPGPAPAFDRAAYRSFPKRPAAEAALEGGEIDVLLDPQFGSRADPRAMTSPTRDVRFLYFNLESGSLGQAPVRLALACMIDQGEIADFHPDAATPLVYFVPSEEGAWSDPTALLPCAGLDEGSRLQQAIQILRTNGYAWEQEPSLQVAGGGLRGPGGAEVPGMQLLTLAADATRADAGAYIEQRAQSLGLPVTSLPVTRDTINYAVLSSHDYDMAIVGWDLGPYPGYLCDWFSSGGIFEYGPSAVVSLCGQLDVASDLESAQMLVHAIQQTLAAEVPAVPLFSTVVHERLNGVGYPFASVLGGLVGAYGAPSLAFPTTP